MNKSFSYLYERQYLILLCWWKLFVLSKTTLLCLSLLMSSLRKRRSSTLSVLSFLYIVYSCQSEVVGLNVENIRFKLFIFLPFGDTRIAKCCLPGEPHLNWRSPLFSSHISEWVWVVLVLVEVFLSFLAMEVVLSSIHSGAKTDTTHLLQSEFSQI